MVELEGKYWSQIGFSFDGEPKRFVKSFEKLRVGDSALDTFREVLRLNPQIKDFSVILYDPSEDSITSNDEQFPIWFPKGAAQGDFLFEFSKSTFRNSQNKLHTAICSSVSLEDGGLRHIPMVDFSIPVEFVNLPEELNTKSKFKKCTDIKLLSDLFAFSKGAVLNSGESFHYWSPNLMKPENWEDFMYRRLYAETRRQDAKEVMIYDKNSILTNINRNFSALRIFEFESDTTLAKKKLPYVVSVVN